MFDFSFHPARSALLASLTRLSDRKTTEIYQAQHLINDYMAEGGGAGSRRWDELLIAARKRSPELGAFVVQARHAVTPAWHALPKPALQQGDRQAIANLGATSRGWRQALADPALWLDGAGARLGFWVRTNNMRALERALVAGADPNGVDERACETALMIAAGAGNLRAVSQLLRHGASPRAQSRQDGSIALDLALASRAGNALDIALALIEAGTPVDHASASSNTTALLRAAQVKHMEVLRKLLALGANPNGGAPQHGVQPLDWALDGSQQGVEAALTLIARGAPVDHFGCKTDASALMWAVRLEDPGAVWTLMQHGADPTLRSPKSGATALGQTTNQSEQARTITGMLGRTLTRRHPNMESALWLVQEQCWPEALKMHALLRAGSHSGATAVQESARARAFRLWEPNADSIAALAAVLKAHAKSRAHDTEMFLRALLCLLGPHVPWGQGYSTNLSEVPEAPAKTLLDAVVPHLESGRSGFLTLRRAPGSVATSLHFHAEEHRDPAAMLRLAVEQVSGCILAAWKKDCADGQGRTLPRCRTLVERLAREGACLDARVRAVAEAFTELDIAEDVPHDVADVRGVDPPADAMEHLRVFLAQQLRLFAEDHGAHNQTAIEEDPRFGQRYFNATLYEAYLAQRMPELDAQRRRAITQEIAEVTATFDA